MTPQQVRDQPSAVSHDPDNDAALSKCPMDAPEHPPLSTQHKIDTDSDPSIDQRLSASLVSTRFLEHIPRDFARQHLIVSHGEQPDGTEQLAVAESSSPAAVFNTGVRLQAAIETTICDGELIAQIIDEAYSARQRDAEQPGDEAASEQLDEDVDRLLAQADRDLLSTQGKAPVVKLVDALLFEALSRSASDVHVQPLEDGALVRYRLDGVLHTVRELPTHLVTPVLSRIKVMGRMDIAERRIPQDGRATVTVGGRKIDLRISTLPTSYGERAVIRLLDNTRQLCDFDALGMPKEVATPFLDCARRSHGIILSTGPTGSGKTTTLYATLREIGSSEVNIMTIEDPIEYELSSAGIAISQAQVNTKKGVSFATGLRHILRQDPDVVMVGEIRDVETARIAIQSSLTGHLVFSTLHTNDAPSAITRLIDLGIESYLVSASLSVILAQRLVRRVHAPCEGDGCEECLETGYRGRVGLFELLIVDEGLRELINDRASLSEIRSSALAGGMTTLQREGERLVREGVTSEAEVRRVIHAGELEEVPS